jgi:hypothetical protein
MNTHTDRERLLALGLERLSLSTRAKNCLKRQAVSTIGELVVFTSDEVFRWQNAGKKTVEELRALLGRLGLRFRNEVLPVGEVDNELLIRLREEPEQKPPVPCLTLYLEKASSGLQRSLVTLVESLHLSTRSQKALKLGGVSFLGELAQMHVNDLRDMGNVGKRTANELADTLGKCGLQFGMTIPDWSRQRAKVIRQQYDDDIDEDVRKRDRELLRSIALDPVCLEDELARIARAIDVERNAQILARLWGWDGSSPKTLEAVGSEFGLTRERVRQIEARALKRLAKHQFDTPHLLAAITLLRRAVPDVDGFLAGKLRASGIARSNFSPWSVQIAAEHFALKWPFEAVYSGQTRVLTAVGDAEKLRKAPLILRRRTSEFGCINIVSLGAELAVKDQQLEGLRRVLEGVSQVTWLDEAQEWMYASESPRNRLFNVCAKVLGVVSQIHVGELRRAVGRVRRLPMCPPKRILAAFVETTGLARVIEGVAYPVKGAGVLVPSESSEGRMLEVLKQYGPVMDGEEFGERCIAAGINPITFYIYRLISPLICALGRNVYCRVGTEVPPGTVEAIVGRRRSTPRVSDHGWTPEGKLWFGTELARVMIVAGSIRIQSFVAELVQGSWNVVLPDGTEFGTVMCRDVFIWTFRKQFALLGAEPSDLATFEFDLKARTVLVKVGGPGLFEAIQDPQSAAAGLEPEANDALSDT